jgi:gamma-glutamyltranspeptidase/glutathione hydrolase
MAATSHPLATLAALNVLQDGGNAMDAAVAACAVQGVVEPQSTGIGGDCFVLLSTGGGEVIAFNGSGRAPAAAAPEWFQAQGIAEIERQTPHSVTIPGAVDAWSQLLRDHGTRDLGALLQPAIAFARDGYPVHARVAFDWAREAGLLSQDPAAARIFLPDGRPPAVGSLHRQPELAATLECIAEQGRAGFYEGPVAEDMVAYLHGLGGLHTLGDFTDARGDYVTPIKTEYRGHEVYECPPNGQGIVALQILNILSGLPAGSRDPLSVERLHGLIEATRLAYRDRDDLIADPAKARVPVERLLSEGHAAELRGRISPERAMTPPVAEKAAVHADTVYLCVVDKDRNAVSFINSVSRHAGQGRPHGHALRRHGRAVPGHGPRLFPGQRAGLRPGPAGGPGPAPAFRPARKPGRGGKRRAGGDRGRAGASGPRIRPAGEAHRRRPGDPHRLGERRPHRGLGPAQGRLRAGLLRALRLRPRPGLS